MKRVSILLIAVALVVGMVGCGGPFDLTITSTTGGSVTSSRLADAGLERPPNGAAPFDAQHQNDEQNRCNEHSAMVVQERCHTPNSSIPNR